MSGLSPYDDIGICEVGLRPGEKLFEELLMKPEELGKTCNGMIFVEREEPLEEEDLRLKLDILKHCLVCTIKKQSKRPYVKQYPHTTV